MDIIIRNVTIQDAEDIRKISMNDLGYKCDINLVKSRIQTLDNNREQVFVAEVDNKVIGYVHVEKFNTLYYEPMVNIQGMVVDSNYQRKGIGKRLMERAEKWGREIGASKVRLNSGIERIDAHKFYRAIGYDDEKEQIRFMKTINK